MRWVILHNHIANHDKLVDPDSNLGKDISQNDSILVSPSWYCPLLLYTLLFPLLNQLKYITNVDRAIEDLTSLALLPETCGGEYPEVSVG